MRLSRADKEFHALGAVRNPRFSNACVILRRIAHRGLTTNRDPGKCVDLLRTVIAEGRIRAIILRIEALLPPKFIMRF